MSNRALIRKFAAWQAANEPLALVSVVATEGSTYSKAGRHILINTHGEYAGLVSGGCLEGDLAEHAQAVLASGTPQLLRYDMRDEADELWGIGVGCNGLIEVLVQKLDPAQNWEPFTTIAAALASPTAHIASLVTDSKTIPVGSLALRDHTGKLLQGELTAEPPAELPQLVCHENDCSVLHWRIEPWPRLLVLGAGPDAAPVCRMALDQGWSVSVADHRPASLNAAEFAATDQQILIEPDALSQQVELAQFNACVVMSHQLETDRIYLQQLATDFVLGPDRYLGVLGPAARREKLLASLDSPAAGFAEFIRGPVGLDIGADSPESIALALISEIQAVLARRGGGILTPGRTQGDPKQ